MEDATSFELTLEETRKTKGKMKDRESHILGKDKRQLSLSFLSYFPSLSLFSGLATLTSVYLLHE